MPRKTMKHSANKAKKTSAKRPTKTNSFKLAEAMEKEFRATPAKIAAQYRKDAVSVKQQEQKLKAALQKVEAQMKKAKSKHSALSAKKPSATTKKQLMAVKKTLDTLNKSASSVTAEHVKTKALIQTLSQKQTKYSMLGKELSALEKMLETKSVKTIKPVKARKNKDKTSKTMSPSKNEMLTTKQELPVSTNEPVEMDS